MSDSPVDRALSLLVSGEPDAALRWSAAALECDPSSSPALLVTARALWRIGHRRAAADGFRAAAWSGARAGDIPLAIAALADLRAAGVDPHALVEDIARVACSKPVEAPGWAEPTPWRGGLQAISPLLTRRALVSRATQMVYEAAGTEHAAAVSVASGATFLAALSEEAFRRVVSTFETLTVPAGYRVVEEGREGDELTILATGSAQIVRRRGSAGARTLTQVEAGAMLGEMSMLARLPAPSTATTTGPAVLLVASRRALDEVAERHPDLRRELDAHCRGQAVGNLGSACAFMTAMPTRDRSALVDRMTARVFGRGERLVRAGEEARGLYLVLSGEVALVAHEKGERVVMSTLTAGDVVGEAELVLCRAADTDAVAMGPTATLFLPRDEFFALALDYPAVLHGLYSSAVRRHGETEEAVTSRTSAIEDADAVQLEEFVPPAPVSVPFEVPRVAERSRATAFPPPLASSPGRSSYPPRSRPSSIAPVAATVSGPLPASRAPLLRRSVQGAAVVAVAASVAAVLAMHQDHPSALSPSTTREYGLGAAGPAASDSAPLSIPLVQNVAPPVPETPAEPAGPPTPPAATTVAEATKHFLVGSLKKRRLPAAAPPRAEAPAAAASEVATPRTIARAPAASSTVDEFGGRE